MPHLGHWGGGWLPYSRITSISCTWRCTKWIWRFVRIVALPCHTSTGNRTASLIFGKETRQWWESSRWVPSGFPHTTLWWVCWWVWRDPTTKSAPHSGQCNFCRKRSQYVGPSPSIRQVYASADILTGEWQGWHTMITVLWEFVRRLTRSKSSVRTSKYRWSRTARVDAIRPSPAYNYTTRRCIKLSRPYGPASSDATTVTKWHMTASTKTLKSVGDMEQPWFTPRYPLKGGTWYTLALDTMVRRTHYIRRSQVSQGPTP